MAKAGSKILSSCNHFVNKNVDHPVLKIVFVGYFKIFIITFDFIC